MIDFDIFRKKDSAPDMTPMIDMVFLLLIFFMLTSVFSLPAVQANLPDSTTSESIKADDAVVTVKEDGTLFLDGRKTDKFHLKLFLKEQIDGGGSKTVIISSDRTADFALIMNVMDISREAGAESVSFLTKESR